MLGRKEARVRVRAGVEQRRGPVNEPLGARRLQPEKLRKAEIREGVPAVRAAFRCRARRLLREKTTDCGVVSNDRCGVDTLRRNPRMRGEDRVCVIQRAVPDGRVEKLGVRIGSGTHLRRV